MSKINITDVVNEGKFNRFHLGLLICCCLIIVFDMFDLVIYSSVIPVIMEEWSISPVQAGAIGKLRNLWDDVRSYILWDFG